jgi:acyl carrier protein
MGLDSVELVMAVEEKFAIELADEEVQDALTPRMLYEVVEKKLRTVPADICLSQRAFYLLRQAFRKDFSIARSAFRPGTLLESLVPLRDRIDRWEQLKQHVGALTWPKLKLPKYFSALIVALLLGVGTVTYLWTGQGADQKFLLVTTAMGIAALIALPVSRPLRTSLAGQTVGSLTDLIVTSNSFLVLPVSNEWTRERIRLDVRRIIVEQLAVSPDFSDDASFVDDLGLD